MPKPPIQTVVGNLKAIRHMELGEGRPAEVMADIECPDCKVIVRWSAVTEYPNDGIACDCPERTWAMHAVTNVPRQSGPAVVDKGK